jgi:hypothetical protein
MAPRQRNGRKIVLSLNPINEVNQINKDGPKQQTSIITIMHFI